MDNLFLQQVVNGLTLGCVYALIALGYTLIFGVMRLIFFAQGEICMVGAFGALAVLKYIPLPGFAKLPAALCAALLASVMVGTLAERFVMRPLRQAARTKQLIASLGVSMFLQNAILLWVTSENIVFPSVLPVRNWVIKGINLTPANIAIVTGALLLMLCLELILHRTRAGLNLRAVAESAEAAQLDGIPIDRTIRFTFVLGSALAAFAGVMLGSYYGIAKYDMGFVPGIKGFTAAILGGFGQPRGAVLGGILLGLSEGLAAGYISSTYKDLLAFAILVVVLVLRPQGLLGRGGSK